MNRILIGVIVAVASFILVDSLSCNKCSFGLAGLCISTSKETCSTNTSVCFTAKATFPSLTSFSGFSSQGCRESSGCDMTTNSTLLGVTYEMKVDCCSTDDCNLLSGAPSTKMTLTAVAGVAVLASMWGSML